MLINAAVCEFFIWLHHLQKIYIDINLNPNLTLHIRESANY